jgi:hypothetical protein
MRSGEWDTQNHGEVLPTPGLPQSRQPPAEKDNYHSRLRHLDRAQAHASHPCPQQLPLPGKPESLTPDSRSVILQVRQGAVCSRPP